MLQKYLGCGHRQILHVRHDLRGGVSDAGPPQTRSRTSYLVFLGNEGDDPSGFNLQQQSEILGQSSNRNPEVRRVERFGKCGQTCYQHVHHLSQFIKFLAMGMAANTKGASDGAGLRGVPLQRKRVSPIKKNAKLQRRMKSAQLNPPWPLRHGTVQLHRGQNTRRAQCGWAAGSKELRGARDSFTSEIINFVHRNIRTSNKTIGP